MAKAVKVLCDRCEAKVRAGDPFCLSCGTPTEWASHEERVTWELTQWQRSSAETPHQSLQPPKKRTAPVRPAVERRAGRSIAAAQVKAEPAAQVATVTQLRADVADEMITVTVLRALNERVRELEERIRRMEAEPAKRSFLRRR